jgi:hypothetical protein
MTSQKSLNYTSAHSPYALVLLGRFDDRPERWHGRAKKIVRKRPWRTKSGDGSCMRLIHAIAA